MIFNLRDKNYKDIVMNANEDAVLSELVYINGKYVLKSDAVISVFDRGVLFADSVYENIPAYFHKPRCLELHLKRLQASLDRLSMPFECSKIEWKSIISQLIKHNQHEHQSVYVQITRGAYTRRCHAFPQEIQPTLFIFTQPIHLQDKQDLFSGCQLITLDDTRWRYTSIKTTNLLPNILHLNKALNNNADEVVLIKDGAVIEGTCSNIFMVKDHVIITPPIQEGMLSGITRKIILDLAAKYNIPYCERRILKNELYTADEIWFSNSIDGVMPVTSIDAVSIPSISSDNIWSKMYDYYTEYLKDENS